MTCPIDRCGTPATEIPGRLPNGWVRVQITGKSKAAARWYCSPACAIAALTQAAPGVPRPDVGSCPLCATRHDLAHRCRSCGHTPPRPNFTRVGLPNPSSATGP